MMFPNSLNKPLKITDAPEGHDARIILDFFNHYQRSLIFVARDLKRLNEFKESIKFYTPDTRIIEFPPWDCPPYSRISPNPKIVAQRIFVLGKAKRINQLNQFIILTTAKAVIQRVPPSYLFKNSHFSLKLNSSVDSQKLIRYLELLGYIQVPNVYEQGEYAIRGGIVDVFPPGYKNPFRIDFFGDKVEGIRQFLVETQTTIQQVKRLEFLPTSEVILDDSSISRFRNTFRHYFGAGQLENTAYSVISEHKKVPGIEHWLPFFYERTETFFDYFPEVFTFFDFGVEKAINDQKSDHEELYQRRKEESNVSSNLSVKNFVYPPDIRFVYFDELLASFKSNNYGLISPFAAESSGDVINGGGKYYNRNLGQINSQAPGLQKLIETAQLDIEHKNILVACWTEGSRDRVKQYLIDEGVNNVVVIDNAQEINEKNNHIMLAIWQLPWGFTTDKICIISEQDIFGKQNKTRVKKRNAKTLLQEFNSLQQGEIIIHEDHGVGRFDGLEVISTKNLKYDCIALQYAQNDKLYLPIENIDLITRYGQGDVPLDRLGGTAWAERKARVQEDLFKIADEIIRTSAQRKLSQAPILQPDNSGWDSLIARFPFVETEDQEAATQDILSDLESGKPMDRLICGDVGFGKTELAIRAAYVATIQGKQVAVLAPTTLLVQQHMNKFLERLSNFPIIIEVLSSMKTKKEAETIIKKLEIGQIDIIVGTHSLLSDKVRFKQLGLVIIDEEQNFGVEQKEKLKKLKSEVHILTLTATPIPRTLQLALSGLKDISLLITPPLGRQPISTFITEFDPVLLRQSLIREKQRGGQSIIIVPRIMQLTKYEKFLKKNVPEVEFVKAHGRMNSQDLEEKTTKFFNNQTDCILATTIISSGIDVPNANTIIVCDSQRFGLGQLYQIRGRVGRSNTRSYAYITYPPGIKLSEQATNRFRIFSSLDSLGAGLSLASNDLDLRGAGNLLGEKQSGHIKLIGFELYHRMLEEAVKKLEKQNDFPDDTKLDDQWTPKLNLGVEARIPESYISNLDTRLGFYQRLANLTEKADLEKIAVELIDRFGHYPIEVRQFIYVLIIKGICKNLGVKRLECSDNGLTLWFREIERVNVNVLIRLINSEPLKGNIFNDRIFLRKSWKNPAHRLKSVIKCMNQLKNYHSEGILYQTNQLI
ncbi:MAG: transcription-repair coupling factor [Rhodobacteraceae bacterium]|nr:transcription-repair coupling factor [Paracoccaceae bacterium]